MARLSEADQISIYARVASMDDNALLTPGEVAAAMRVDPKTVTRWAAAGKISAIRTLGGHRRFKAGDLKRMLAEDVAQA